MDYGRVSEVYFAFTNLFLKTWDEGLAITARAWARNCLFEHNIHLGEVHRMHPVFPSVGENIWAAYPPSKFTVTAAINSWVNEKQHYDYRANSCTNVCGHYTQVSALPIYTKYGQICTLCIYVAVLCVQSVHVAIREQRKRGNWS